MHSGESYGMPAFTTAASRSSHVGGGGGAANTLSQLFGHQMCADLSGHESLHPHGSGGQRAPSTEQDYISDQQQQQLQNVTQQAPHFLFSSALHHHGRLPSFFRASTAVSAASQQQYTTSLSSSHGFFMGTPAHSAPAANSAPEQFELLNFNQISQRKEDQEQTVLLSSTWSEEETAALSKICADMDFSTAEVTSNAAVWEEVARKLLDMGYQRSPPKCKAKFESMPQSYVRDGKLGAEGGAGEQEFSSDFYSEGGHADNVEEQDDEVADEANNIVLHERDETTQELLKLKKRKLGCSSSSKACALSKAFFERLTQEIMQKQESLHRSFLETLERKDKERALREEAHRRQEAARLDREQEIRAQEASIAACRDAALIAFLEKATGQTFHGIPKMTPLLGAGHVIPPGSSTSNGGATGNDAAALNILQASDHHLLESQADFHDAVDMYNSDLNTKRWPKVEVHALIRLRSGMEPRFREAGPKAHLWEEISASMACLGFTRSAKRCKEKWENINKYFKKTKDSSKKRPENAKTCPYFHQLDTLYQRGILASSSTSGGTSKAIHGKSAGDSLTQHKTQTDDSGLARPLLGSQNMQISDHREESGEQYQGRSNEIINDHQIRITDGTTAQSPFFATDNYKSNLNLGSGACAPSIHLAFPIYPHHHHHDGAGVLLNQLPSKKSVQLEMFVKNILDLQQQQHQKLVDEYDRMEQSHEPREMERAQQQQHQEAVDEYIDRMEQSHELRQMERAQADIKAVANVVTSNIHH